MKLVAGVDSSTQSCKVTIRDVSTGKIVRMGRSSHPVSTQINPERWWNALLEAFIGAGGLNDVDAISIGAQMQGMICLDEQGRVIRDAMLWNDTSCAPSIDALNEEFGAQHWIRRTGSPLVVASTVAKARWLRDNEPQNAARTAAICLPHDYLTWRLRGFGPDNPDLSELTTDRSDASGTGYWSAEKDEWDEELLEIGLGKRAILPTILGPRDCAGVTASGLPGIPPGIPLGVGGGDNALGALALGLEVGDGILSIGTSGTAFARASSVINDPSGLVSSYADCTGDLLPMAATLNAARDLDAATRILGRDHDEISSLARQAAPGAEGVTLLPYFEGERTPYLPTARGSVHGLSLDNANPRNLARAFVEGMVCGLIVGLNAVIDLGIPINRLLVIGGAARNRAVQQVLTQVTPIPIVIPKPSEYVTVGAAMQAVAAVTGEFPVWEHKERVVKSRGLQPQIMKQHVAAKEALGYPV
ncbi:FGGY family carbohydrate kinase [Actinomycetaceae bacterium L2_0104]